MSVTLLLILVVIFSFIVGHYVTQYLSRYVMLSGAEYLLVGVLIGPQFAPHLVSAESLELLQPVVSLLLGVLGFVLGLRARSAFRRLAVAPAAMLTALGVVVALTAVFVPLATWLVPIDESTADFIVHSELVRIGDRALEIHFASQHLYLALFLAAAGCVASTAIVASVRERFVAHGRIAKYLSTTATASQLLAVFVLGLVLVGDRATGSTGASSELGLFAWEAIAAGCGIVCGLLFSLFIGSESDLQRLFLASVAAMIFAAGIGTALEISPLFVNLFAGITVAVISPHEARLRAELGRLEHPLFVLIMIFGGAMWVPVSGWLWLFPVAYVVARYVALRLFARVATRALIRPPMRTARVGNGLLAQGALAVAIGVNVAQSSTEQGAIVLTTVIVGTLASDLWSIRALRTVLADAGEITGDAVGDLDVPMEEIA